MHGFVAVTDPAWYERLSREVGPRDANFWRPSTRRFNLAVGTPFFFKLSQFTSHWDLNKIRSYDISTHCI